MPSFDIVSEVNWQEIDNAVNQAKKEIMTRYDLKGTKTDVMFEKEEIKLSGDDDYKLNAAKDILQSKLLKRGISLKALDYQKTEEGSMGVLRQTAKVLNGLSKEKAKEVTAIIKETKLKVQAQIQDEQVRVSGKSINDLQAVIQTLKAKDIGVPLQFTNMKS